MPVGVPEQDVFAAADRVLARGERPTTERVRVELGRGSPARVGKLLETWWDALAKRLAGETRLPELPPAVAEAFKAVWVSATEHGTHVAEAAVADTRAALTQAQARMAEERTAWEQSLAAARAAETEATAARKSAEARLGDLQRLLDQQALQLVDVTSQRDSVSTRYARLQDVITTAQTALADQRQQATQEREVLQQHVRATEERANTEVDRARQEAKAVQANLTALQREYATLDSQHRQQREATQQAVAHAEREAAAQRARADALEQQLTRLGDLPAALQARLAQGRPGKRPARSATPTKPPARKRTTAVKTTKST